MLGTLKSVLSGGRLAKVEGIGCWADDPVTKWRIAKKSKQS